MNPQKRNRCIAALERFKAQLESGMKTAKKSFTEQVPMSVEDIEKLKKVIKNTEANLAS